MSDIWLNFQNPSWWFTVFICGIIVGVISNHFYRISLKLSSNFSNKLKTRYENIVQKDLAEIKLLSANDTFFLIEIGIFIIRFISFVFLCFLTLASFLFTNNLSNEIYGNMWNILFLLTGTGSCLCTAIIYREMKIILNGHATWKYKKLKEGSLVNEKKEIIVEAN